VAEQTNDYLDDIEKSLDKLQNRLKQRFVRQNTKHSREEEKLDISKQSQNPFFEE
jgi:hypothetical protein